MELLKPFRARVRVTWFHSDKARASLPFHPASQVKVPGRITNGTEGRNMGGAKWRRASTPNYLCSRFLIVPLSVNLFDTMDVMTSNAVNPYQPPPTTDLANDRSEDGVVRFYNTDANLRFAESHFVLRLHPMRLIVVSLALIAASSAVMIFSLFFGPVAFAGSSIAVMVISALIYLASIHRTKLRLRERSAEHGMRDGTISSVEFQQDDLVLTSTAGIFRWPIGSVSTYRTRKGLMVSPEPLLCVFVPKRNQSSASAFDELKTHLRK